MSRSGLQREVIVLYRRLLRTIRTKNLEEESAQALEGYTRAKFDQNRSLGLGQVRHLDQRTLFSVTDINL